MKKKNVKIFKKLLSSAAKAVQERRTNKLYETTKINEKPKRTYQRKQSITKINCVFQSCELKISKSGHKFCYEHWLDDQDGFLRKCKSCQNFIDIQYEECLDCKYTEKTSTYKPQKKYQKESNPRWDNSDKEIQTFFVYILKLDDDTYYAGQTNNLKRRIFQHKERNTTKSTKGKEGKLMWFAPMPTRDSAAQAEVELKKQIDKNPSKIDERIIAFRELLNLVDGI